MRAHIAAAATTAVLLTACTNHPIVNDLTGFSTYDVVHKVRCEAKQALTDHVNEKKWHRTALSIPTTQTKLAKAQKDLDGNVTRSQILADLDLIKLESEDNRKKLDAVTLRGEALVIRLDEIPKELKEARTKFEKLSAGTVTLDPSQKAELLGNEDNVDGLVSKMEELTLQEPLVRKRLSTLRADIAARKALSKAAEKRLEKLKKDQLDKFAKEDEAIKAMTGEIDKADPAMLTFLKSSIAMQFRFDILETNVAKVDGSYKFPVQAGALTMGFAAGTNNKRKGERAVGVSTTFEDLLKVDCVLAHVPSRRRATMYPITGNIGIRELMHQYLVISGSATLAQSAGTVGATKQFTDRIVFTTKINAGLTPKLELSPTPVHKVALNAELSGEREDIHEVIVDVAPPAKAGPPPAGPTKVMIERVPEVGVRIIRERDLLD